MYVTTPVTYDGKDYRTCKALFQAIRFKGYPDVQEEIRECKSPMGAKMIARKNRALLNRNKTWDEATADIALMKMVLKLKLKQHSDLKTKLIATGNATIIEDCATHDRESARFWGAVKKNGKWIGKNVFGKLWMELRADLIRQNNIGVKVKNE